MVWRPKVALLLCCWFCAGSSSFVTRKCHLTVPNGGWGTGKSIKILKTDDTILDVRLNSPSLQSLFSLPNSNGISKAIRRRRRRNFGDWCSCSLRNIDTNLPPEHNNNRAVRIAFVVCVLQNGNCIWLRKFRFRNPKLPT